MNRLLLSASAALVLLGPGPRLRCESWFASDGAGIPGRSLPRSVALREEYALSVDRGDPGALPDSVRALIAQDDRLELSVLFQDGRELFRRSVLYDRRDMKRYSETRHADGRFFSEVYGEGGMLLEEQRREGAAAPTVTVRYTYDAGVLRAAETAEDGKPILIDRYRYDRSGALRRLERTAYSEGASQESLAVLSFPRAGTAPEGSGRFGPGADLSPLPAGAEAETGALRVSYETDSRGRVLAERVLDAEGATVSETRNTWAGDRLASVVRIQGGVEYRSEYGYDVSGKRISERNYRAGVLERSVSADGEEEVELLYAGGRPVLRARWAGERKVSEERLGREGSVLR